MVGQTNINTCTVSKLNYQNVKVESKLLVNLLKNCFITGYCLKDILTFLGINYKDTSLKKLLYCPRNQYSKNQIYQIILSYKNLLFKS